MYFTVEEENLITRININNGCGAQSIKFSLILDKPTI